MTPREVIQAMSVLSEASIRQHINQARATDLRQLVAGKSPEQILAMDWDKFVLGVSDGEIREVDLASIHPDPADMENVHGQKMYTYFSGAGLETLPPAEVAIEFGSLYLADGHHRYAYAIELGKKTLRAVISIRDNPFKHLGTDLDQLSDLASS